MAGIRKGTVGVVVNTGAILTIVKIRRGWVVYTVDGGDIHYTMSTKTWALYVEVGILREGG